MPQSEDGFVEASRRVHAARAVGQRHAMIYVLGFLVAWLRRRAWQHETDRLVAKARHEAEQDLANELFERRTPQQ